MGEMRLELDKLVLEAGADFCVNKPPAGGENKITRVLVDKLLIISQLDHGSIITGQCG